VEIYSGKYMMNDKKVILKNTPINNKYNLKYATSEIEIIKLLDHQNINKYIGFIKCQHNLYLILENCNDGTLSDYMKNNDLKQEEKVKYIKDLVDAIQYLHQNKIVHRDLKPKNIFLNEKNIKIGDFGISKNLKFTNELFSTGIGSQGF
jgi:5'-AMP-activated protein kinase, catalytic alpha subunit